jgi:hypothetical protein
MIVWGMGATVLLMEIEGNPESVLQVEALLNSLRGKGRYYRHIHFVLS